MIDLRWIQDRLSRGGSLNGLNLREEEMLRAHARASGLKVEQLIAAWRRERGHEKTLNTEWCEGFSEAKTHAATDLASNDLDCWPLASEPGEDDVEPVMPDHDDDDDEQTTKTCPTCNGKGTDHSGATCQTCGGSGRVPIDDVDEELESRRYEIAFDEE
jgi:hypothetical protein